MYTDAREPTDRAEPLGYFSAWRDAGPWRTSTHEMRALADGHAEQQNGETTDGRGHVALRRSRRLAARGGQHGGWFAAFEPPGPREGACLHPRDRLPAVLL